MSINIGREMCILDHPTAKSGNLLDLLVEYLTNLTWNLFSYSKVFP